MCGRREVKKEKKKNKLVSRGVTSIDASGHWTAPDGERTLNGEAENKGHLNHVKYNVIIIYRFSRKFQRYLSKELVNAPRVLPVLPVFVSNLFSSCSDKMLVGNEGFDPFDRSPPFIRLANTLPRQQNEANSRLWEGGRARWSVGGRIGRS